MKNEYYIVIVIRLLVFCLLQTSYVPDEYFQFTEPALKFAFSVETIQTWEWFDDIRIRSYVPLLPLIYCFKLLKYLNIDYFLIIRNTPRFLQTVYTIVSDLCLYSLCRDVGGTKYADEVLWIHLFSWSGLYCLSRTLTNCMEMNMLIIGLYLLSHKASTITITLRSLTSYCWNWYFLPEKKWLGDIKLQITYLWIAMLFIAVSIFIRPTIILLWIGIGLWSLYRFPWSLQEILLSLLIGKITILSCILLDTGYYERVTVSIWNFLQVNVLHGQAMRCFGTQPWYWIFTEGIAVILGLYAPIWYYSLYGLYLQPYFVVHRNGPEHRFLSTIREFGMIVVFYLSVLVLFTRHQEHRFLLPILPFCHMMLAALLYTAGTKSSSRWLRKVLYGLMVIQGIVASYLLVFHQGGTEIAFDYVVKDIKLQSAVFSSTDMTIVSYITILAPCYTFPGYARIHGKDIPGEVHLITPQCSYPWDHGNDGFRFFDTAIYNHSKTLLQDAHEQAAQTPHMNLHYVLTFDSYVLSDVPPQDPTTMSLVSLLQSEYKYHLIHTIPHAHFRYDLDDPFPKYNVMIYREQSSIRLQQKKERKNMT